MLASNGHGAADSPELDVSHTAGSSQLSASAAKKMKVNTVLENEVTAMGVV